MQFKNNEITTAAKPKKQHFMSSDDLLSCFIYILLKAGVAEMPALTTFIGYYTLDESQD